MNEFDEEANTLPQHVRDVGLEDTAPGLQPRARTQDDWPPAPRAPVRLTRHAAIMRAITAPKVE